MPITPYLEGCQFDPETKRLMGVAFQMARAALGATEWGELSNEVIARRIIALAKTGERDPNVLCERVVAHFHERGFLD
jgi:hypothetical protein